MYKIESKGITMTMTFKPNIWELFKKDKNYENIPKFGDIPAYIPRTPSDLTKQKFYQ